MKLYFLIGLILCAQTAALAQTDLSEIQKHVDRGELTLAKKLLTKANDADDGVKKLKGEIALKSENWDKSAVIFEGLIEKYPNDADFHFKYAASLGMKALEMSKFEAAFHIGEVKKHFKKAAELDQTHLASRWALVRLYLELPGVLGGSISKAHKTASELMSINRGDGWQAKGYIAEYQKDPNMIGYYEQALKTESVRDCFDKLMNLYKLSYQDPKAVMVHAQSIFSQLEVNEFNYLLANYGWENRVNLNLSKVMLGHFIKAYSGTEETGLAYAYLRMAQIHIARGKKKSAKLWIDKALAQKENFAKAEKTRVRLMTM